ncbi:MAG: hypothetical protein WEC59_04390 [Salibacteraceae bacterium]
MKKIHLHSLVFVLVTFLMSCQKEEDLEPKELDLLTNVFCEDTCVFSNDGDCDDGSFDSTSDFCSVGTDCSDCGERTIVKVVY